MIYHAIRNIDHSKALYQKKNKILAIIDNMFWTMSILTFFVRLPNIRATGTAKKKVVWISSSMITFLSNKNLFSPYSV